MFFPLWQWFCPFNILLINLRDLISTAVDSFTLVLGLFSFLWGQKDKSKSGTLTLDVFSRQVLILYLVCARLKCVSDDVPIWYDPTRVECVCYTVLILLGSSFFSLNHFYRVTYKAQIHVGIILTNICGPYMQSQCSPWPQQWVSFQRRLW